MMQRTFLPCLAEEETAAAPLCPDVATISRLISGFGDRPTANFRSATIETSQMAHQLKVTFRPLPRRFKDKEIITFRDNLASALRDSGVEILSWNDATNDLAWPFTVPLIKRKYHFRARMVRTDINSVFDVKRKPSLLRFLFMVLSEVLYFVHTRILRNKPKTFSSIGRLVGWSWDHAVKFIRNYEKTQVVTILRGTNELFDPDLTYERMTRLGARLLFEGFSPLAICVSDSTLRVVNLNMADSTHQLTNLPDFVLDSLVPKLFLPIQPLPLSRFDVGTFDPRSCPYAERLVEFGKSLKPTGLLPDGISFGRLFWQRSHRDLVDMLTNGRRGASFGFVAFLEPPVYFGARFATAEQWEACSAVEGFSFEEVRQNERGRYFLNLQTVDGDHVYHQIPDIWLISSRSGARKTAMSLNNDIVRVGLCKHLKFQVPDGVDPRRDNVNPSYDTYVMVAIGLSAALFAPEQVENGAPIVHFHGYPSTEWLEEHDKVVGAGNPSVPCGTFESGVFNFRGIWELANSSSKSSGLTCLLEPDHGTNIIHGDMDRLLTRLIEGCRDDKIRMGGQFFNSLRTTI